MNEFEDVSVDKDFRRRNEPGPSPRPFNSDTLFGSDPTFAPVHVDAGLMGSPISQTKTTMLLLKGRRKEVHRYYAPAQNGLPPVE